MKHTLRVLCVIGLIYTLANTGLIHGQESGEEILEHLRSFDAVCRSGFTMSGTYIEPGLHVGPRKQIGVKKKWTITTSNDKIAYEEEIVEVLEIEAVQSLALRSTWLFSPQLQAKYDYVGRVREAGKLPPWPEDSAGPATSACLDIDKPTAPTYKLPLKKALWSIGRGFSDNLTAITSVTRQDNGLLSVVADGTDMVNDPGARWELVIDPQAAYMVREATFYKARKKEPYMSVSNSGSKWVGSICVPEQTELTAPFIAKRTTEHLTRTAQTSTDEDFLNRAERTLKVPYLVHTDVHDRRMSPTLYLAYRAGELFPKGRKGQEQEIVFGDLLKPPANARTSTVDRNDKPADVNSKEGKSTDANSLQAVVSQTKSSPPSDGATTRSGWTKRTVAYVVLIVSIILGITYLSFYILKSRRTVP